jgi:hypothetical protein
MAGIAARVKQWPPTGRKAQSKREQALILKTDARSILEFAGPTESATLSSARDGKAVPYRVIQPLLASLITYITEVEAEEINVKNCSPRLSASKTQLQLLKPILKTLNTATTMPAQSRKQLLRPTVPNCGLR